jgi:hypothetical protein
MKGRPISLRKWAGTCATVIIAIMISANFVQQANSQVDLIRKTIKKVDDKIKKPETPDRNSGESGSTAPTVTPAADIDRQASGRFVFSKQPIDPGNPANLTNSFSAGDHIYGALLLSRSFRDFVSDQYVRDSSKGYSVTRPGFEVDFMLDDSPLFDGTTKFVFQLEQKEGAIDAVPTESYFFFDIAPEPAQARTYKYDKLFFPLLTAVGRPNNKAKAGAQYYAFHLSKLGPGNHTVKVTFIGNERFVGEFTITGSSFAFYRQVSDSLDSVASANAGLPRSEWNNPTLARSVGVAFRKAPGETVVKVVLISPSWFIQKNSIGIIIHRGLFAVIATRARDGKCYIQKEYFKQLYRGGGRYGPTAQDGRSETRQVLPCGNIK